MEQAPELCFRGGYHDVTKSIAFGVEDTIRGGLGGWGSSAVSVVVTDEEEPPDRLRECLTDR